MCRVWVVVTGLVLATGGLGRAGVPEGGVAPTEARTPEEERRGFHLPDGFEAQLVADETQIHKPLNLAFDDRGRLWVTETVEYPFPATEGTRPRDAVKVLDDFDGDGRARRVATFADGLNIPIGVLPIGGGSTALVHSIPAIWRLADTDGDGKADRREALYQTFGSKDTHGMTNSFTWGFDGWVYACHGFANTSDVKAADGSGLTMTSGHTFRFRPDGSRVEVYSHGQVNPFGITFSPMADLFSADCHTRPLYLLLRGAYYPSFGRPDDGLGFGPEMVSHDHGSTAIDAALYYAAEQFPARYRDTLFVGNVVTNRINHDAIEWHGSTPAGIAQPDFLVSDDPWFRPVAMQVGPDGALYVADFYNRIIGHYEVPLSHPGRDRERGRIWRILYKGPEPHAEPVAPRADWTNATVSELIQDLGHPNLVVRLKATNQLSERGGEEVIEAIRRVLVSLERAPDPSQSDWSQAHALWVLHRRGSLAGQDLSSALASREPSLRVHAFRVLAERPTLSGEYRRQTAEALNDADPFVRRAAAEALGRHPSPESLRPLLDLRGAVSTEDTHLLHVVKMALRDQLLPPVNWEDVPGPDWAEPDHRAIAEVAMGIPTVASAHYLMGYVLRWPEPRDRLSRFVRQIARYGDENAEATLLKFARAYHPDDLGDQAALLKAIHQGTQERGAPLSDGAREWAEAIVPRLIHADAEANSQAGIALAGALKLDSASEELGALIRDTAAPGPRRSSAMGALAGIDPDRAIGPLTEVLEAASGPIAIREPAANALAKLNRPEARAALLRALPAAPGRLQSAIAVGLAASPRGAEDFLTAVAEGKASARLLQEKPIALRLEESKVPGLRDRIVGLLRGLPPADQALNTLIERRRAAFASANPEVSAGASVFAKACAACHQLDGRGARVGPQLDGVGLRGVDRLMEDILDPNRNVDQAFRSTTLALDDGQVVTGLLLKEEGDVLVLADAQGKEIRVPKGKVEDRTTSSLSPMPANFGTEIPEADFLDLTAYLLSRRPTTGEGERN